MGRSEVRPDVFTARVVILMVEDQNHMDARIVSSERQVLEKLYEVADYPRDFRVRIFHEAGSADRELVIVGRLDVIDSKNPGLLAPDPRYFELQPAPPEVSTDAMTRAIYEPLLKKDLEAAVRMQQYVRLQADLDAATEWGNKWRGVST